MTRSLCSAPLAALVGVALSISPAYAVFHFWDIKEVFSNHDGSVQFIELFTTSGFEQFTDGTRIQATSDGAQKTFTFNRDLSGSTAGRHLLIATPGFGDLPNGVAPDFFLPDPSVSGPFFNPNATSITIQYVGADSPLTFAGSLLPKNGMDSLTDSSPNGAPNLSPGTNSPTNFNNGTGSVNVPPPPETTGDYNGDGTVNAADYTIWRDTFGQTVDNLGDGADGDGDGEIGLGDYDFWKSQFGTIVGGSAAVVVPEPSFFWLIFCGVFGLFAIASRTRSGGGMIR